MVRICSLYNITICKSLQCFLDIYKYVLMNVQVISEKDLIKQLKKEVALLESKLELSTFPVQSFPDELVLEKEIQIQKV